MAARLLVMPGDGIGPEITAATLRVLEAASAAHGLGLEFEEAPVGLAALAAEGTTLPAATMARARQADGLVLGPLDTYAYPPRAEGGINASAAFRTGLDLHANIRPARTRPGLPAPCGRAFDLVVMRENTEGFYADRNMHDGPGEMLVTEDVAIALRRITRASSTRIAEAAFALAATRPAAKVTAVHKANVLAKSDGLFLDCCRAVAARHPGIAYEEVIVDAMAAHLVRRPEAFDVVVTTNMYGDILSDQASEMSGGLGLAASLNCSETQAMAQAQHGAAPDIAGRGIANPASLIGSAAMLLRWLAPRRGAPELAAAGAAIEDALDAALADPATRTADLGGRTGTMDFAAALAARLGG